MTIFFVHGWGFNSAIWDSISELLPDWPKLKLDRGYFGAPRTPVPETPCIAVTHSFGTMLALADPPPHCIGLIAVNGFDRFVAHSGSPGVHRRVLKRMIGQFETEPEAVLREFRNRCGCCAPFTLGNVDLLGNDLQDLANIDYSQYCARIELPVLSLQGDADPILPKAMCDNVFSGVHRLERLTLGGGHLLPLTEPVACASAIREFAGVIA
ncbi:MAG: alpha/beta hydrolase [Novosphingobium sp.]|nr:alpha/beta hydrolase [Novosphingobium sp.]